MVPENVTLSQLYSSVKDSVVVITDKMTESTDFGQETVEAQGSGFAYNFTGRMLIVTNNHVIADATNISVTFSDGNGYPASVLGSGYPSQRSGRAFGQRPGERVQAPSDSQLLNPSGG